MRGLPVLTWSNAPTEPVVSCRESDWYGPMPVGPEGVFARILIRTPKEKWWNDPAKVATALRSYGRKRPHA